MSTNRDESLNGNGMGNVALYIFTTVQRKDRLGVALRYGGQQEALDLTLALKLRVLI